MDRLEVRFMGNEESLSAVFKSATFKLICFNCGAELEWVMLTTDIKIKPCRRCQDQLLTWARKEGAECEARRIREIGLNGLSTT